MATRTASQRFLLALGAFVRSACFAGALTAMALVKRSSAQSNLPPAASESGEDPASMQPDVQNGEESASGSSVDRTSGGDPEELPPDTNLETGSPLTFLLTPFRWGRFSFLSVTANEGYNSNSEFERVPVGAFVTSINTLAIYSTQFAGWRMNLQYQPFFWFSSTRTIKDFAAASADIRTSRRLDNHWHWTARERFRYLPTHSTEQGTGFEPNAGGGFGVGNIFLSSGRDVMVNAISGTLTDHYGEHSTLSFRANQDFTRLSTSVGTQQSDVPIQEAITFLAGAAWRRRMGSNDTFILETNYRFQTSVGTTVAGVHSQNASVGWDHRILRNLGVSGSIGPTWSTYSGRQNSRVTLHGSLALSKEFRGGGVVLGVARNDDFSGVISDRFSNRADIAVHRQFNARWSCSASISYVEQQLSSQRATRGTLAVASAHYFISRNWAVFTQVRYLDIAGVERIVAPGESVTFGVRWAWVPEKP